jgi:hypothetical protein
VPSNLSLRELLLGARKRELLQLFLDRSSQALAVAMAGTILLLLLGTQILEWYWVALLALASLGVGLWRVRGAVPSLYALAQRIDHRLNLADALSTATFFSENPDNERAAICRLQQQEANEAAQQVDLKAAIPMRRSRYLLPAAGLALVAMGLFAVRYMVTGSLSLKPSFVAIAYDTFFGFKPELAKNQKGEKKNLDPQGNDQNSPENQSIEKDPPPEDLLSGKDAQEPTQGPDNAKESVDAPPDKKEKPDDTKSGDEQPDGKDSASNGDKKDSSQDKKDGQQNSKDSKNSSQSQQSMMDKLKDAMQNLMNSMKSSENNQQNAKNQGKQNQKAEQKGEKGDQSKSDQQSEASAEQAGQEGQQQQSDSKSAQKSSDKNSQQDAKNGAGSQDGDKLRRQAEELKAMGKISELLGQRTANITGEVTVEVGSSKQQLKTPWSTSQATHRDAGGEVHRDEVPLIYQEFVRQYFEEIHKSPPQEGKPAAPRAPGAKGGARSKANSAP